VPVAVVDEVHAAAGGTDHRALDVLDDVDEVFQIPRLTNQAVQVVEDHSVDDAGCQITEELSELRTDDHPVDRPVGAHDLALLERRGVVLLVDLCERSPAQPCPSVLGVFLLAVDSGFDAEAVGGDPQIGSRSLG
jgi:hypothetical protein